MAQQVPNSDTEHVAVIAIAGAFIGTVARLPYWHYAPDLKRADGTPDPRAGLFNPKKALSEVVGVPAIASIVGGFSMAFARPTPFTFAAATVTGLMGTAFIYSLFEGARGPLIETLSAFLKRVFGAAK